MGLLCVVLFLQVSHKAHLEPVDILDVPKDDFQLVIVEHVYAFPALTQIPLQQNQPQITARPSLIKVFNWQLSLLVQMPLKTSPILKSLPRGTNGCTTRICFGASQN